MINQIDANNNVGRISIKFDNSNDLNSRIVDMMTSRFKNVYQITVDNSGDIIDSDIYDSLEQLVKQSTLLGFGMCFQSASLSRDDDAFKLIKKYNQLIKQKQHLESLVYQHNTIDGYKFVYSRSEIEELIDEIDNK